MEMSCNGQDHDKYKEMKQLTVALRTQTIKGPVDHFKESSCLNTESTKKPF